MKIYQNNLTYFIALVISCFFVISLGYGFSQTKNNIDRMLIRHIDIDGDGLGDDVNLYLRGEGWDKPLSWILTITTKGQTIFKHESNDSLLDRFFNDNSYVNDTCKSYMECKKQYYLIDLLSHLFIKTDLSENMHVFDITNNGSIHHVAKNELMTKFNLSESDAAETIEWMIKKIKSKKTNLLYVPLSPVSTELPRMYVDRVGKYVTIYQW